MWGRLVVAGLLVAVLCGIIPLLPVASSAAGDSPDYAQGALTVLGLIRDGKYEDATAYFNDEVAKALSASQLHEIWKGLEAKGGRFQRFGTPTVTLVEKYHAVDVPAIFDQVEYALRLAWDEEGSIAGFRIMGMKDVVPGESAQTQGTPAAQSVPPAAPQGAPETPRPPATPAAPQGAPTAEASDFLGHWEGTVELPNTIKLPIRFDLARSDAGWTGTLDSPQQGANGLALSDIQVTAGEIRFGCPSIPGNASFEGRLDQGNLVGTLTQMGMKMPFHLSHERLPEPKRPQEPKPPFPYKDETVSYMNGDVRLEGSLTIPEGKGPFPAALLITGSGPQDRNEEIFGHKPFLLIADDLTRAGIAVLRVDDRGVGGSTGKETHPTSADFAQDVMKGVEFLRARPEIDPKRIGLIGHSEGGFIAPMVAADSKDIAFIVLLAGTGVPGDQIMTRQAELIYRESGVKGDSLQKVLREQRELFDLIESAKDTASVRDAMWKKTAVEVAKTEDADKLTPEQKAQVDAATSQGMRTYMSPWFRYFLTTDPRPFLRKVKVPVLALNGEHDLQVDPTQNLPEIQKALEEGGNKDVTVRQLPGLNHLFQTAATGSPSEYGTIEETMSPEALRAIREWIVARFGNK